MVHKKHQFILHPHPRPIYPYLILGMAILFHFYKLMLLSFPTVIANFLQKDFALSINQIRFLSTIGLHTMIFLQLPVGFLLDRFSPKKIVSISIFIASIGGFVFATGHTYKMAILGRILIGCGGAAALINILKLISNWFYPKRFAFLAGLSLAFGVLGGTIGQNYFAYVSGIYGWRSTLIILSIVGLIYAFSYLVFVRDNEPGMAYNINPKVKKFSFSKSIRKCFRHPQTWYLSIFTGLVLAPLITFMGSWVIPLLMRQFNLSVLEAVWIQMSTYLAYVILAPTLGYFSTRQKKRKIYIQGGSLLLFILTTILFFIPPQSLIINIVIFTLIGAAAGTITLSYTMIHERNIPKITGTAIGFLGTAFTVISAIEFHIIDIFTYPYATFSSFKLIPISILCGWILSFFIRETHAEQRLVESYRK